MWKPGEARRPPELLERYVSNDTSMIIICGLRGVCGPETLERSLGAPATGRPKVQVYARGSRAKPEGLRPLHDKHEDCKRSLTTNPNLKPHLNRYQCLQRFQVAGLSNCYLPMC